MSLYVHAALPTWLLLEVFHVSFAYSPKILRLSCRDDIIRPYAFCFVFLGRGSSWYHRRLRTVFHQQEPVISRYGCHYRRNNVFLCGVATFLACAAPLWCSSLHGHLPTAPQNATRGRVAKVNTLTSSENKERLDSGTALWSPLCQANVGRSPNVSRCLSPPC